MVSSSREETLPSPSTLEWLYLVAGLFLVQHYRWLFDDAFIFFRYVDNLLFLDLGLVYNAGEYVEGYSSPAQCLLLILLRSTHLAYPAIVWLLGAVSFGAFWYLLVVLNRLWSPKGPVLNLPLAYLAFNYGTTSYFTSGLETPLVHVMAASYALFAARPTWLVPGLLVAISPLVRPELVPPLALALGLAWYRTGRFPWRTASIALLINGAWLLFRVWYYADLLPNTYYLKDDFEPGVGWVYLENLLATYHPGVLLAVCLAAAGWLVYRSRQLGQAPPVLHAVPRAALLLMALSVTAYVVKIGGAPVHYWYLAFPFTLAVCSVAGIAEHVVQQFGLASRRGIQVFAMGAVALVSFSFYPEQLTEHPFWMNETVKGVDAINDPSWHRHRASLQYARWKQDVEISRQRAFAEALARDGYPKWQTQVWCQYSYQHFDTGIVHGLGLTEPILARADVPEVKQGHRLGLKFLAQQLLEIRRKGGGPGMYRRAVENGVAPEWVERNLATIELLEAKTYNRHDLVENLRLALRFPPRLEIRAGANVPD